MKPYRVLRYALKGVLAAVFTYPSFAGDVIGSTVAGEGVASARIDFLTDGTITVTVFDFHDGALAGMVWATGASPGDSHWICITETGVVGSPTISGIATGTWLPMTSARFSMVSKTIGNAGRTLTVRFATDAGGTNVVSTHSVTLSATHV